MVLVKANLIFVFIEQFSCCQIKFLDRRIPGDILFVRDVRLSCLFLYWYHLSFGSEFRHTLTLLDDPLSMLWFNLAIETEHFNSTFHPIIIHLLSILSLPLLFDSSSNIKLVWELETRKEIKFARIPIFLPVWKINFSTQKERKTFFSHPFLCFPNLSPHLSFDIVLHPF